MIIFKQKIDLTPFLQKQRELAIKTAFIPTMGALHQGHISLIELAKKEVGFTVCSIFVNPTQFNNPSDFEKYPITIDEDIYKLEKAGCDVLFLPLVDEMYPNGQQSSILYNLGEIETILEGKYRLGHFQGVCQIVHRLLDIVQPTKLYLGQKDYQQCMVIKKLIKIINCNTQLVICPTQREVSGLAMSSRNMRLSMDEKKLAAQIYATLEFINAQILKYPIDELKTIATAQLTAKGFKVDYVEIADSSNLQPIEKWNKTTKLIALIAVFLKDVRLIDNLLITN